MRASGNRRAGVKPLENLEFRTLLSRVLVTDFGAVPNDGNDDSGAIRAAINASQPGDVIMFPAGTFDIGSPITLKGDRSYKSRDDAVLKGQPDYSIFVIHQDNIRIAGLTFDGKPIFLDKAGGEMVSGIAINDNTFHVHATGENYNGINFTTGLRNSSITNNTFDPIDGDNGIYGYFWDNLKIANNSFMNGNEGIHVIDLGISSRNLLIEQNYFSGLRRMGIEYQGGGTNTIVQDNFYENPSMTGNFNDNNHTFAYSLIADRSSGSIIRRNTAIAPQRPDGVGVRIVFEVGGDNTLVEENYSVGSNHVLAANDGFGTTSILARNNLWSDYLQGPIGRGLTLQNNGPDTPLSWNVDRGRPGPYRRLTLESVQERPQPVQQPLPAPPPAPLAPPATPQSFAGASSLFVSPAKGTWDPAHLVSSVLKQS